MRASLILCCLSSVACSKSQDPPPPTEYIQFSYRLTPATTDTQVVLPIEPGSQPCGRQTKEISVKAEKGRASFQIQLKDAATMPAQLQARSITNGKVNVDVALPAAGDMGGQTVSFSSADPGDLFVCTLQVSGPDPFVEFKTGFECTSKATPNGQLTITEGEARVILCVP